MSTQKTFEQLMKEYGLKLAARELDRAEATRERLDILCGFPRDIEKKRKDKRL